MSERVQVHCCWDGLQSLGSNASETNGQKGIAAVQ